MVTDGYRFYRFMNRSAIKFSYSALSNVDAIVAAFNKAKMDRYREGLYRS